MSPTTRISFGLVVLTLSILLAGDMLGLTPGRAGAVLEGRKKFCETLAVHYAMAAQNEDLETIRRSLDVMVERNDDVISAGLRGEDNSLLAEAGEHAAFWQPPAEARSTATHALVPIYRGDERWATVEVHFEPLVSEGFAGVWESPIARLLAFVALAGFGAFLFYMRRTLRHLDPSAVIPPRVKAALDVLAEGVILLDERERIVLANDAFAAQLGEPAESLLGLKASELPWRRPRTVEPLRDFPWMRALRDGEVETGTPLVLDSSDGEQRTYSVNGAPILDGQGKPRGALATFDDVTELQQKNDELQTALDNLEESKDEISKQNDKLQFLASRDPLTSVLNRRSFFERLESDFQIAQRDGKALSCIMMDIDHFKSVNDNHGHAKGDEVIKAVAEVLTSTLRMTDTICRYGGEEFCVTLAGIDIEQACEAAERVRANLATRADLGVNVTASLGVSSIALGARDPAELIAEADKSLYGAKETGRNRVCRWDELSEP